jgi:hypothetical protein
LFSENDENFLSFAHFKQPKTREPKEKTGKHHLPVFSLGSRVLTTIEWKNQHLKRID